MKRRILMMLPTVFRLGASFFYHHIQANADIPHRNSVLVTLCLQGNGFWHNEHQPSWGWPSDALEHFSGYRHQMGWPIYYESSVWWVCINQPACIRLHDRERKSAKSWEEAVSSKNAVWAGNMVGSMAQVIKTLQEQSENRRLSGNSIDLLKGTGQTTFLIAWRWILQEWTRHMISYWFSGKVILNELHWMNYKAIAESQYEEGKSQG